VGTKNGVSRYLKQTIIIESSLNKSLRYFTFKILFKSINHINSNLIITIIILESRAALSGKTYIDKMCEVDF
jgi:hypothetical protein